ncbi:MAG: hypothetical protein ACHP84_16295 [Caulobacterales bacterium]
MKKIEAHFGSREGMLGFSLVQLSSSGQPCDVTFYKRKPILDVKVDQQLGLALAYGAGAKKLQELLSAIKFSDGTRASLSEIWTVNPMPKGGFSVEELEAVDLAGGEAADGPNGETLRQMISETYHCQTREEEDRFLRRFIAS